jgi:hypothetical protein
MYELNYLLFASMNSLLVFNIIQRPKFLHYGDHSTFYVDFTMLRLNGVQKWLTSNQ